MSAASIVLIAGASAGGLGVYLGIDQMAEMIHAANATTVVLGMPDSGFFMQYSSGDAEPLEHTALGPHRDDASVLGRLDYALGMRNVFTMTNMTAGANAACVREETREFNETRDAIDAEEKDSHRSSEQLAETHDVTSSVGRILHPAPAAACAFAANIAPHIRTPLMTLQVRFSFILRTSQLLVSSFTMKKNSFFFFPSFTVSIRWLATSAYSF